MKNIKFRSIDEKDAAWITEVVNDPDIAKFLLNISVTENEVKNVFETAIGAGG